MDSYQVEKDNARQLNLSHKLKEISGIAFSADGRLFAHDDERAVIYQLNPDNGQIIKYFYFGLFVKKGDFEDIEIVGKDFYLVASNGTIYKFKEGADKERVDYESFDTGLHKSADVEGMCYDPTSKSLLLALKGDPGKDVGKDYKAVYSFDLVSHTVSQKPRFILDKKEIEELSKENDFEPSGIARHPVSGDFYLIAAAGNLLLQLSATGKVKSVQRLSRKLHNQPEGIAFSKTATLFISDEGKKHGTLTIYTKNDH